MKYCSECKVNVNERHDNCPLCGSYAESSSDGYLGYSENIEPYIFYPALKIRDDQYSGFMRRKMFPLLLVLSALCIALNLWLSFGSFWSGYVVCVGAVGYFCVLTAVEQRRRFYAIICTCAVFVPAAVYAIDILQSLDRTKSFELFGLSVAYIVPVLYIAALILTDVMIFADRNSNKYYMVALILTSVLALVPQFAAWGAPQYASYAVTSAFAFSLTNAAAISIVNWTYLKNELKRKFSIK